MSWEWELTDLDGVTIDLLRPRSVTVQRNLNAPSTIVLAVENAPVLTTAAVVRGWRAPAGGGARVIRATGKVRAALQLAAARDELETLEVQAGDGLAGLSDRYLSAATTFTAETPRAILASVVGYEADRANTGLYLDPSGDDAGPPRDRTYDVGKNVAEIVAQLAEVDDGFYYRVDPAEGTMSTSNPLAPPGGWPYWSKLILLHPAAGTDTDASFEFGAGTRANLAKVQVDIRPPVNRATAFGSGQGDGQLVSVAGDNASINAYGLVEVVRTFSDVTEQATLDQHALDMLRPEERRTFKVEVATGTSNGELYVPSPWDDFDVGDTVALNIRTGALTYTGRALVKSFTVTVDANLVERLAAIDFQEES